MLQILRKLHRRITVGTIGTLTALLLLAPLAGPGRALAQGQSGSLNATDIDGLLLVVLFFAVFIFFLVNGLLIYAMIRYRRRADDEMPEQVHGSIRVEGFWTVFSIVIVVILFFFTLGFYSLPRESVPDDAMRVEVTGNTWYWDFYYPETDILVSGLGSGGEAADEPAVATDDAAAGAEGDSPAASSVNPNFRPPAVLRVPAGEPVILEIKSNDVQHSFWVPELAGKVDAVPGRTQLMWFQVDAPQTFIGQCAEHCGREHYNMLIRVVVMEPAEFQAWMDERVQVAAELQAQLEADPYYPLTLLEAADPANGQALYTANGCAGCHSLEEGQTLVGPSFYGLADRIADRAAEAGLETGEQYLLQSIVNTNDFIVAGFQANLMPQNFGEILAPEDLADLVAFLLEQ